MTASWKLQSTLPDGSNIELEFCTRNIMKPLVRYAVSVSNQTEQSRRFFKNQRDAEEWARDRGVVRWSICECNKAHPFAELIPVAFPNAPPPEVLDDLIEKLNSGLTLSQLADLLNSEEYRMSSVVSPAELRMWMIGHDPLHIALTKLRDNRRA